MTDRERLLAAQELVEDMLDDERYEFAWNTIQSIEKWMSEHDYVTEAQYNALVNINESVHRRS